MECKRCGKIFCDRTHLFRHLNAKRVCKPVKSNTGVKILIDELQLPVQKLYICDKCSNSYKHQSSLYRHKKNCQTLTKTQTKALKMITPTMTINVNSEMSGNINVDARTINIWPCSPEYLNFVALARNHNLPIAQAFAHQHQPEALLYANMRTLKPESLSFYAPSTELDEVRYFDGKKYAKRDDGCDIIIAHLKLCIDELQRYVSDPKTLIICKEICDDREVDFDLQLKRLQLAKADMEKVNTFIKKANLMRGEVEKVIKEYEIPVE